MLAYKFQTPGNYPEESIQHLEQGESLKSRKLKLISLFPCIKPTVARLCISKP
jgi:hypothetical protein